MCHSELNENLRNFTPMINFLKNIKNKKDWKKYHDVQEYWDDYSRLSVSEQEALDKYNEDRWARREKRIDRSLIILGIIISFCALLFTLLRG